MSLPICYLGDVPDLKDPKEVAALIQRINAASDELEKKYEVPLGLIIIDTLAAAFAVEDENSNSEAASMIRGMKEIGKATGAIILPVHHYGKAPSGGLRGASAFFGGTDVVLSVLADIDHTEGTASNRRLTLAKSRDDETGPIAPFELRYVEIGIDEHGAPYGSSVVEPLLGQAAKVTKGKKESPRLKTFRQAFAEMTLVPYRVHGDGPQVMAAKVGDVRAEFDRRYATGDDADPKKRADSVGKAFKRALEDAKANGFATDCENDVEWIWQMPSIDDAIAGMVARSEAKRTATDRTDFSG